MHALLNRLTDTQAESWANKVGDVFKSLPHLPKGLVEFFVKVAPYLALLGAIMSLLAGPLLGVLGVLSLLTLNPVLVLATVVAAVLALVNAALLFMAFSPLKARLHKGWMYLFWADMLSVAQTIVMIVLGQSSLMSIVFILIGLYVLFEMRPFYRSAKA